MTAGEGEIQSCAGYRALLDHVSDLVLLVDDAGTVSYANATAARTLGVDPDALVGESLLDRVHEADVDELESLLAATEARAADERLSAEVRVRTGDGEWTWQSFSREGTQPTSLDGVVVTARDVTAQRRIEERFRHLVETASDLFVVLDEDGTVTYATPAASRVLGYEHDELVGENVLEHIHPDDRDAVATELHHGLDDPGYTATIEHRFRTKSGEWRWLESRGRSLPDAPALEGRVVVVTRDITDRHRRERQITAQNERLNAFTAMVSHDLQNPLAVASGSLELYRQTGDEAALDRVDQALRRTSELTSDLLSLSRQGRTVEDPVPVDIADCVTAALETSPLPADTVTVAAGLPTVRGDESRVRSLFENLFRNVADHAGDDPRVWVEPLAGADGVGFAVEDDGPGIPVDAADSVFELGHSSDRDGTGIGLYIVDTIAAAHGWDVSVTTGRDGGARFEFTGIDVVSAA
ncbi:PAS domain S-box protein [Salinigranum halophilum]|uniref:PAS domain S-box protein n=1 Tax=Salinigranum halophilum TaxID=2565931 RepID=UPI00115EDEF7|nr:PAS domain S-box protein [Salinigranum halophilum]